MMILNNKLYRKLNNDRIIKFSKSNLKMAALYHYLNSDVTDDTRVGIITDEESEWLLPRHKIYNYNRGINKIEKFEFDFISTDRNLYQYMLGRCNFKILIIDNSTKILTSKEINIIKRSIFPALSRTLRQVIYIYKERRKKCQQKVRME